MMSDSEKSEAEKPKAGGRKIQWSLNSMMKQMEATDEEKKYRKENFSNVDVVNEHPKHLRCTKCSKNFQSVINQGIEVGMHPLLGVLLCNTCCDYYGDGNFSLDSEGEDKYCRWCGEGGTIFACSKCICGFCDECIKKHFGESGLEAVQNDDDWVCYLCNPKPLWYLRSICSLAKEAVRSKKEHLKNNKESKKRKRRKKESLENDLKASSSESNGSNSRNFKRSRKIKRTKSKRFLEDLKVGEWSSSGDEKLNHIISKKNTSKLKKDFLDSDLNKSSGSDSKILKDVSKASVDDDNEIDPEFKSKRALVIQKLKSIWRLTETVSEVGFKSSREKMKTLREHNFNTYELLKKECEDLKSCLNVLISSLNSASNSFSSIKEDLTFEDAKDETETFRTEEIKLKRLASKFQEESDDKTAGISEGDGLKKARGSDSGEDDGEVGNVSKSLFSDSNDENNSAENRVTGVAKPLLKVKSFAKMLEENLYDQKEKVEEPIVIDLYNIETDESEGENANKSDVKSDGRTEGEKKKNFMNGEKTNETAESDEGNKGSTNTIGTKQKTYEQSSDEKNKTKTRTRKRKLGRKGRGRGRRRKKQVSDDEENSEEEATRKSTDEEEEENEKVFSKKFQTYLTDEEKKEDQSCLVDEKIEETNESENEKTNETEKGESILVKDSSEEGKTKKSGKVKHYSDCGNKSGGENKELCDSETEQKKSTKDSPDSETERKKSAKDSSGSETERKKSAKDSSGSEIERKKSAKDSSGSGTERKKSSRDSSDSETERRKSEKDSSDSETERRKSEKDSSDEGQTIRKKRRSKTKIKASFEKFKQKREQFLKSTKENSETREKDKAVKATKVLESSDSETETKQSEQKPKKHIKKRIVASSDEDNGEVEKDDSNKESAKENENENEKSASEEPNKWDETTSDDSVEHKKRKRIKRRKGSSDSSEAEAKKKQKKDSSESSEDEKAKKKKKGRKNIKKILKKDSLKVETKEALKNEEERKKRVRERQRLFEELFPDAEDNGKLILDFNPKTKEPVVVVHKKLSKKLKPHQAKGVKFMWDNCFESVQKLEEESGSGCILAHCMGLGKTLQVVTLVHTVMTHEIGVNSVLIVCPLSTVSNWIREFEMWLDNVRTDPIILYDLVKYKKREERLYHLKDWHENGGVLVLSYDLFRNLTKTLEKGKKKKKPKYQQVFETALLDPGPDLVVCDEGHLLKNEDTALSKCMSKVKTSRRIVLTGTPLQNNLIEYHCMVQFVKPNILGTKKEFCNRFVNPINNGQFEDSTELDVKIMKRRSHVLHSMLDGCIQRFDYSVLVPFLPEKHEYVLTISLTEKQAQVYVHFIQNLSAKSSERSRAASLFNDYHGLQRIWTHPRTLLMHSEKELQKDVLDKDSEGSLKDFIVSTEEETGSGSDSGSSDSSVQEIPLPKRVLRSNANDPEIQKAIEEEEKKQHKHWWDEFYDEKAFDDIRESNKLVILFSLLQYCKQKKDKVLVFSQSLYSLDLIEYFLSRIDENGRKDEETLCGHCDTWILGSDYFRLDGSTHSETRAAWCKHFNKESNTRARLFLISTRAGGLGINLYGANRVVIFDASWNPSHDLQSIFRVYRFGQKKICYIYRFLAEGTMEEKIYERQVTKLSLAHRVVDEHQIERHYTMGNLQELYTFQPTPKEERKVPKLPKDSVLADLLAEHKGFIVGYHEHDSLLENKQEEELSEEERKAAWKEYEEEKAQKTSNMNAVVEQQMMFVQQAQFSQGTPIFLTTGQSFVNPAFLQSSIPLDALHRGVQCGVTPLPNESLESYYMRIFNRENWLIAQTK